MRYAAYLGILYSILIIFAVILMGVQHEAAHVAIFEDYGIESHVEYWGHGMDWVTISEAAPAGQCNETCHVLHNVNEIVSYNLMGFLVLIGVGFLFILIIMSVNNYLLMKIMEKRIEDKDIQNDFKQPETFRTPT
jgi:hypothetical protein